MIGRQESRAFSFEKESCLSTKTEHVLVQQGILDKYGVELIGAKLPSINKAEDRELFKCAMKDIGLKTPPSGTAETWEDAIRIHEQIGKFPLIIRPAFTLGGSGGGIAYNMEEYEDIVKGGLAASVTSQVLILSIAYLPYLCLAGLLGLLSPAPVHRPACPFQLHTRAHISADVHVTLVPQV